MVNPFDLLKNLFGSEIRRSLTGVVQTPRRQQFLESLRDRPSGVYLVVGRRGSGKTAFSLRLAEHIDRQTFSIGLKPYPNIMAISVNDVGSIPPGSILIIDDASLIVPAREYEQPHKLIRNLINQSRHRGITVIINSQQASAIDRFCGDADAVFIKPGSPLLVDYERRQMGNLMKQAMDEFSRLPYEQWPNHIYCCASEFTGMVEYKLPGGWEE